MSIRIANVILSVTMACVLFSSETAVSQPVAGAAAMVMGGPEVGGGMASTPEELTILLKLRVEEMRATIGIDESQANKLHLAAKVVARKVFDEQPNPLGIPFGGFGGTPEEAGDSFSDEDKEAGPDRSHLEGQLPEIELPVGVSEALDHKSWKKALKSVLTEEQHTELEAAEKARQAKAREVAVRYRVFQLQAMLRLKDDQLAAVSEVVDRIEGEDLLARLENGEMDLFNFDPTVKKEKVEPKDLKEILTPLQFEAFELRSKSGSGLGGLSRILGLDDKKKKDGEFGVEVDGVTAKSVVAGSRAAELGIQAGDLFDSVNGELIDTPRQLRRALRAKSVDSVTVIRGGKTHQLGEE